MLPAALEYFLDEEVSDLVYSIVITVASTLTTAVFAGCAEETVHRWNHGEQHAPLREILGALPPILLPLIGVGILQAFTVAFGFVLLIVPGLIFLAWFSLAGPVVVAERTSLVGALRRSRELVLGNTWRVLAVVVIALAAAALVGGLLSLIAGALDIDHERTFTLALGEALTLPLEGLALPVMYWRLRAMEDGDPAAA